EGIGRAGSDDQQVGAVPQSHVQDVRLTAPQFGVGEGPASGYGLVGERRDESLRRGGEDHIHLCAFLREPGGQLRGLIGRNGAGDAQKDVLGGEDGRHTG
ncbi:MAG: hypothetical protein FD151_1882, partial [bacterium]